MPNYRSLSDIIGEAMRLEGGRVGVCLCPHCGGAVLLPQALQVMTIDELKREYPLEGAADEGDQGRQKPE
jgi:hypothetical protein